MNPTSEIQRNRLFTAVRKSYEGLRPFRNLTVSLTEEFAGSGYGQQSTRPRYEIVANLMNQAAVAYRMSLAANRPRCLVSTRHRDLKWFARQFQEAINGLIAEIRLEETMQTAVLDAFFCVGIVKTHMADSAEVQLESGFWMDPGTPYASCLSLDNWAHDMSANQWHKVSFAVDSYR
ncbi:MAG: hypothetical protein ACYS5V_16805, partial [Planctomycetota bacterium]